MNSEFTAHRLTESGLYKAKFIAHAFDSLLETLKMVCFDVDSPAPSGSERAFAITKTKLEEACFYAKKAMAIQNVQVENCWAREVAQVEPTNQGSVRVQTRYDAAHQEGQNR